jgi:hypothetical protein
MKCPICNRDLILYDSKDWLICDQRKDIDNKHEVAISYENDNRWGITVWHKVQQQNQEIEIETNLHAMFNNINFTIRHGNKKIYHRNCEQISFQESYIKIIKFFTQFQQLKAFL